MDIDTIDFKNIRLGEVIGSGTFGKVYKANWLTKLVAVKKINVDVSNESVQREFKQLSRANHKNIIFLHGISIDQDTYYLIMEYADGGSLFNFLHNANPQPYTLNHAINWTRQAAEGVAYLHAMTPNPVIHRDLKPLNMMLHKERRCLKLCDFSTVRYLSSTMTAKSGTAAYMAPEVFNGKKYTAKCDVFSWSVTLWEVLSRQVPYTSISTELGICTEVNNGLRPPMGDIKFECPEEIRQLITNGWEFDPEKRPSMDAVVATLRKFPIDENTLSI